MGGGVRSVVCHAAPAPEGVKPHPGWSGPVEEKPHPVSSGSEAGPSSVVSPAMYDGELVFDLDGLVERLGDREFVGLFVRKFVDGTAELLEILKGAIAEEKQEVIHLQSHSIKGAAASIGAEAMRKIAFKMETLAREGNLAELPELFGELERAYLEFREVAPKLAAQ